MQIPPSDAGALKFYHLHLQEDLLDGWTLIREWGFQGAGGRMVKDHYPDRASAENAMLKHRDAQLKKGYRVVFMQAQ
jgi:predicted DNA-binding WGR domain protein